MAGGRALGAGAWGMGASAGRRRGPLSSQGHDAWCGGGWHSTDAAETGGTRLLAATSPHQQVITY